MQLVSTTTKLRLKFYAQVQCQSFHTASTRSGHQSRPKLIPPPVKTPCLLIWAGRLAGDYARLRQSALGGRAMKRREFIGLIGGAAAAWPLAARTQQPRKNPRLAILLFNSPQIDPIGPLLQGLQSLGYVDGKSIGIEYRYAEGKAERLPGLASELV